MQIVEERAIMKPNHVTNLHEVLHWSQAQQIKIVNDDVDSPRRFHGQVGGMPPESEVDVGLESTPPPLTVYSNYRNVTVIRELSEDNEN